MRSACVVLMLSWLGCGGASTAPAPAKPASSASAVDDLLARARAAAKAGDVDTAERDYRAAFAITPTLEILDEELAMLVEHDRVATAVEHARAHCTAHAADAPICLRYARTAIAARDFETALATAEDVIEKHPESADAHRTRGEAAILLDRLEEGVESLRRAVELAGKDPENLVALGSALQRTGKVDEALLHLRSAIMIDPEHGRALMLLGIGLRDRGEHEEAIVFLTQATKHGDDARPWFELGVTQNQRGDDEGAQASLARAVAIEPTNSLYYYVYGETLRIGKKYDEAIAAYRSALKLQPPHPKASAKLGVALFEAKRVDEAEAYVTQAIRSEPANPYNYYNLAVIYREQRKTKAAIEMFEKFVQLVDANDGDRAPAIACIAALRAGRACGAQQRVVDTGRRTVAPRKTATIAARVIEAVPQGAHTRIRIDRGAPQVTVGMSGVLVRNKAPVAGTAFTIERVSGNESTAVVKAAPSVVLEARDAVLTVPR